jgi:hypothetical protein
MPEKMLHWLMEQGCDEREGGVALNENPAKRTPWSLPGIFKCWNFIANAWLKTIVASLLQWQSKRGGFPSAVQNLLIILFVLRGI